MNKGITLKHFVYTLDVPLKESDLLNNYYVWIFNIILLKLNILLVVLSMF